MGYYYRNDTAPGVKKHFVEMQCTGGQSCSLGRYNNVTWKAAYLESRFPKALQTTPLKNLEQSIIFADNSLFAHLFEGDVATNEHTGSAGYSCGNICAVRMEVDPDGDGDIFVNAKSGVIQSTGTGSSLTYKLDSGNNSQLILFRSVATRVGYVFLYFLSLVYILAQ